MGLVEEQVRVCRQQVEATDAVKRGAELAVEECQHQFHARRWNCSTLQGLQVFGKVAIQGQQGGDGAGRVDMGSLPCAHGVSLTH